MFFFLAAPPAISGLTNDPSVTGPTSLGFIWDSLTCQNVNGKFSFYYSQLFEGNGTTGSHVNSSLIYEIDASSISFNDLEACTKYAFLLKAVNGDNLSGTVSIQSTTGAARKFIHVKVMVNFLLSCYDVSSGYDILLIKKLSM